MKPEPNFERVRTALLGGQPDRVPLAELKIDAQVKDAFMGRPIRSVRDEVEFWYAAGYDFVRMRPRYDFQHVAATSRCGNYSVYGDGTDQRRWAAEHKGVITNLRELESFPLPTIDEIDFSNIEEASRCLPDGMKLISGCAGIFEAAWMLMGFETFCLATVEQPELVSTLFQRLGELHLQIIRAVADFECVGALWYTDDIAYTEGLMCSPDVFRKHLFPWVKRMGDIAREKRMPFLYHSDGRLWEVIPDLIECGVTALHPIEPKAMDIREVKSRYGSRLCLIGNIDLSYTLTRGTPEEVEHEVRQRIRDIAPGGGYCVGSSNSVTNYVKIENYRAMLDATRRYGSYPLQV